MAICERALEPWQSRRLAYGRPTPQLQKGRPAHWGYIDDYGVAQLAPVAKAPSERLRAMRLAVRAAFEQAGIPPHKECCGLGLEENLGVTVEPHEA
eukprot:10375294-Lingulodinium_polyedra.AAC.1